MDLKQFEYFVAIADAGSISEAARRLHLSQPPLSYQMKQLEAELGCPLFLRGHHEIELTAAGKLLYERATHILSYADSTKREVAETGKRRVLRIGVTSSTSAIVLLLVHAFSLAHPDVRYEITDATSFQMLDLLEERVLDAGIVRTPAKLTGLETIRISSDSMIAVDQWSADEDPLTLKELSERQLVLYRRYESFILDAFAGDPAEPDILVLTDDARDCLSWVRGGTGTAIVPSSMKSSCTDLRVHPINDSRLSTEILLAARKDEYPSPLLSQFCSFVRQHRAD